LPRIDLTHVEQREFAMRLAAIKGALAELDEMVA